MTSPGFNALLRLKQKLDEKIGGLRLCNLNAAISNAFKNTALDRVFVIKATEKEALADF